MVCRGRPAMHRVLGGIKILDRSFIMPQISVALEAFRRSLDDPSGSPPYAALQVFCKQVIGAKLFTVMETDISAGLAHRAYSSDPKNYATSGKKPIPQNEWFDLVHVQRKPFVANTIAEISNVFPDHELIWSLGCGSVVNLPIIVDDEFVGTVNLLHEEHYYTPERVELIVEILSEPAQLAYSRT